MARSAVLLCLVLAAGTTPFARAGTDDGAGTTSSSSPSPEAAYRERVSRAHELWSERPKLQRRDEASCIEAWQKGDQVRTLIEALTPPERFAAYHEALTKCITASLDVSDECLVKPGGGPKWTPMFRTAGNTCFEVARIANRGKLGLPPQW